MSSPSPPPCIFILGSTGAGKSRIAISLCSMLNGEIINCDSMQVYKGLNIATNVELSPRVRTHLVNILDPMGRPCTVSQYQCLAIHAINDCLHRGKLPVVCGGTQYYAESVLWDTDLSINDEEESHLRSSTYCDLPVGELFSILQERDPNAAHRLNPNDKRRIIRALHYLDKGLSICAVDDARLIGRRPRFRPFVIFVGADPDVLEVRIRDRIDAMLDRGMLDEFRKFEIPTQTADSGRVFEIGLLQCIGYKEFKGALSFDATREDVAKAKDLLAVATRSYASKQRKMFTASMLTSLPGIRVDSTSVILKTQSLSNLVGSILSAYVASLSIPFSKIEDDLFLLAQRVVDERSTRAIVHCDTCDRDISSLNWKQHVKGRKHKARLKHLRLMKERQSDS